MKEAYFQYGLSVLSVRSFDRGKALFDHRAKLPPEPDVFLPVLFKHFFKGSKNSADQAPADYANEGILLQYLPGDVEGQIL